MIIFMFGIVLTLVLFIAMGFVRGEGSCWRWSVCSSSCFRAMSPFRQATPAL